MSISNSADDWQSKAANKRQQLYNTIPSEWRIPPSIFPPSSQLDVTSFPVDSGFFTESELAITSASAATILEQIRNQEWTAIAVARAFSKRAAVAHQLVRSPFSSSSDLIRLLFLVLQDRFLISSGLLDQLSLRNALLRSLYPSPGSRRTTQARRQISRTPPRPPHFSKGQL